MKKFIAGIVLLFISCSTMPTKQYSQFSIKSKPPVIKNKHTEITLSNPLKCPLRFYLSSTDEKLNAYYKKQNPFTLKAETDTVIKISHIYGDVRNTGIYCMLGDPGQKVMDTPISLPFKKGSKYGIIQSYNGSFSHNDSYSQYSIDFNLKLKDTVCAADDGFVVGVIKDYKLGGKEMKWRNYANYITLYHHVSGLYTQYVHLHYKGSFVKVGDQVKKGQPIGLAGMTGWTTGEHLHFNVLVPADNINGFVGKPVMFEEKYNGLDLKSGDTVEKT